MEFGQWQIVDVIDQLVGQFDIIYPIWGVLVDIHRDLKMGIKIIQKIPINLAKYFFIEKWKNIFCKISVLHSSIKFEEIKNIFLSVKNGLRITKYEDLHYKIIFV